MLHDDLQDAGRVREGVEDPVGDGEAARAELLLDAEAVADFVGLA